MAQPVMNAKIEELRYRIKTDPKSRLFYPLAEELRKAGHVAEAEQVLRTGLTNHATYLSAWVSLGRVLRDQKKDDEAVEALNRALQLDPGNVVAARLLADAYLSLGEKVEAIKKYKLVYALLPADEELKAQIETLDRELHPPEPAPSPLPAEPGEGQDEGPVPESAFGDDTAVEAPLPTVESPFEEALQAAEAEARVEEATGDAEPMSVAHDESPFEEPVDAYSAAALTIEAPAGFHIAAAPLGAELAAPLKRTDDEFLPPLDAAPIAPEPPTEEADVFEPTEPILHPPDDLASTITMADLYAKQGLTEDARQIYEGILARDPENHAVSAKLAALDRTRTVQRLQNWLAKVSRREVPRV
jgi:tetratricopeptide (TPR) repeat protein